MTLDLIHKALGQAQDLGTLEEIYFEGGEPFLYHPILVRAAREAAGMGFRVGVVTNGYWATTVADAKEWLRPLAGSVDSLSISSDLYHYDDTISTQAKNASTAAREVGLKNDFITVASAPTADGPQGESSGDPVRLMFRGRAAKRLAGPAPKHPVEELTACPWEDLADPGRMHLDPFGHLHVCKGLVVGNILEKPLAEIVAEYDPSRHPVVGPLLEGGPLALARRYGMLHADRYADACHFCDHLRRALRTAFPKELGPDQVYVEE
jgi:hypothetical protein